MLECLGERPPKRWPISKIRPSDGRGRGAVPLAVGRWYDFHEFEWHLGNVGSMLASFSSRETFHLGTHHESVGTMGPGAIVLTFILNPPHSKARA